MDDRDRRGGPRLRQRGGARTDRLSGSLIRVPSLEGTALCRAAFATRLGGVSVGPYSSLNLAYGVDDDAGAVAENRRRLASLLDIAPHALAEAEQVHGDRVAVLDRGAALGSAEDPLRGVDALVTPQRGLWLAIYAADCVPVLVLDAKTPAVAAAHAGWRGTAAGVVPATIGRMREALGTDPGQCFVAMGPAIGGCCYEVDAPVARAMEGMAWWGEAARATRPGRWHLDLRTAIRRQLVEAGVPAGRITTAPFCTACRPELFFSYRRDGVTGRMAACIGLSP